MDNQRRSRVVEWQVLVWNLRHLQLRWRQANQSLGQEAINGCAREAADKVADPVIAHDAPQSVGQITGSVIFNY